MSLCMSNKLRMHNHAVSHYIIISYGEHVVYIQTENNNDSRYDQKNEKCMCAGKLSTSKFNKFIE